MEFALSYCPDGREVLNRLQCLYEKRPQDMVAASMVLPSAALREFAERHPPGFCEYPDPCERIRFWDACLREQIAVHDDSVPSAYLSEMDQGLYGGMVGGDVRFLSNPDMGWISSMVPPVLHDWSEFERLSLDPNERWFRLYLKQMDIFVERARGKFGISHLILISGLNFVFELFGATETYSFLIEQPQVVQEAIDFAFELNLRVQNAFFDRVPLVEGGTCSLMLQWAPGRIILESVDPFHMTSVNYFERWGREPLERVFSQFDGGALHIHGNGRHLLEAVSTVRGLKAIWLGDDRGFPPAFAILEEIKRKTGDVPLIVAVEFEEFRKALKGHRLTGGTFYVVGNVPDTETANRCMDSVRRYRA